MRTGYVIWAVAFILLTMSLAGCQEQRFTRQRFETLYIGQPAADVEAVVGKPTVRDQNKWQYINAMPYALGTVYFENGRVTRVTWVNERPPASPSAPKQ